MNSFSFIEQKLQQNRTVLLDGATGTELEKRGVPMNSKAWSAEAILTHPAIVQAVHEEYIKAGVDIITVNSFSTARHMLLPAGLTEKFDQLSRTAIQLAVQQYCFSGSIRGSGRALAVNGSSNNRRLLRYWIGAYSRAKKTLPRLKMFCLTNIEKSTGWQIFCMKNTISFDA